MHKKIESVNTKYYVRM